MIISRKQADCKRVVPNTSRAVCPQCSNIVEERDYTGTRLNKRFIKSMENTVALIGAPTFDKVFDRLSVDGGRDDRKVFVGGTISEEDAIVNRANEKFFVADINCDCDYCNRIERAPTEGELHQKELDKSLGDIMMRTSLDGKGLHGMTKYNENTQQKQRDFQKFLNDPDPDVTDVED
jgi:hypothetical protein